MIASSAAQTESALDACDGGQLASKSILLGRCCLRLESCSQDSDAALEAVPCLAEAKAVQIGRGGAGT